MLNKIINTGVLDERCGLTREEMLAHNFRDESGDAVFDSLVKMIISYCIDDTELTVLRKVNSYIERCGNDN